jgi:Ran GTPase-activating protein (RanGAP) involved in mRNA processing and transport
VDGHERKDARGRGGGVTRAQLPVPICIVILALFASFINPANGQFLDDKTSIDYDSLFKSSLKRGGKFLDLSGKKIGDEGVKVLVAHDLWSKVKKVDLRYNDISWVGAKTLADSPQLKNLKSLVLRHNFFADDGAVIFAQSKSYPNLQELQLGWNEIRDAGALAFGKTDSFPKLQKLDLRGNFLAGATKDALKKSLGHYKALKLY